MKIMIFGDTASGKSSFAEKLASTKNLPLIQLDRMMENIGRKERRSIGARIKEEASKPNWIIEGNAFTKDPDYRISQADKIYVFDFNRFTTLVNHIKRYTKLRSHKETRRGSDSADLNLKYFIPYILFKFPPRKKEALRLANSLGKDVIIFKNYKNIDKFLNKKDTK